MVNRNPPPPSGRVREVVFSLGLRAHWVIITRSASPSGPVLHCPHRWWWWWCTLQTSRSWERRAEAAPVRSDALERPYTAGGGGGTPLATPPAPPPPPLMFEADSQNFASAPLAPRGFTLKDFRPAFGGDHRTLGGGGSQPNPPPAPPFRPFNAYLPVRPALNEQHHFSPVAWKK